MPFEGQIAGYASVAAVSPISGRRNAGRSGTSATAEAVAQRVSTPRGTPPQTADAAQRASSSQRQATRASVAQDGQSLPTNAAAETLVRAAAESENQQTGVLMMTKRIGAENLSEMKQRDPSPVEQLLKAQAGGEPGSTVTELADKIAQQSSPGDVDLAASRPDVTDQLAKLRQITNQAISEAQAEMRANEAPGLAQQMEARLAQTNAQQGAYSTMSLAAVSTQAQRGQSVRLAL